MAPKRTAKNGEIKLSPRNDLAMNVAPIAPNSTWPSIPIFHRPAEKVITSANPVRAIIDVINIVLDNLSRFPKAPSNRALYISRGEEFSMNKTIVTKNIDIETVTIFLNRFLW